MNKVVAEAKKIMEEKNVYYDIPELEIGDIVELKEVWDGEGETPEEDYTYTVINDLHESVGVNYEFEIIEENEEELETVVKITDICFL